MNRIFTPVFCLGLLTSVLPASQAFCGYLVKEGEPMARVCVAPDAGRPVLLAVDELRNYVRKMSGADLPVDSSTVARTWNSRIVLEVRKGSFNSADGSDQSFAIEEKEDELRISGNSDLAVLYGVYQYLGELGIRWFEPGEIGENVPRQRTITIGKRKRDYSPSFVTRSPEHSDVIANKFKDKEDAQEYRMWRIRNRLHFDRNIGGGPFDFNEKKATANHSIRRMALKGADINKEPERWPLVTRDGKQARTEKAAQICFTNEKNVITAVESCIEYFRENPEKITVPMGLADCGGICECGNCAKVAGTEPYSKERLVLTYMNKVAKQVGEKMPGKGIGIFFPYFELKRPPADFKMEPNIMSFCCRGCSWDIGEENKPYLPFTKTYYGDLDAVSRAGSAMAFYDYVLWSPPQPSSIIDALPLYKKLGFRHCGSEIMSRNEQLSPMLWVIAQYLWDSSIPPRELLKTFCVEYYGAQAATAILAIQDKIDENSRRIPHIIYGGLNDCNLMMTEQLIKDGSARIRKCMSEMAGGKERQRLERFQDSFDMISRLARIYRAYGEALNERTPESAKALENACADFEKFWRLNDLSATCQPSTLQQIMKLAKNKIEPRTQPKGRKELAEKEVWMRELFAFDKVPANVQNIFPLPELWKFRVDFEDKGLQEGWHKTDCDDNKGWNLLSTWDCFENQGYAGVDGRFWYRLEFAAPQFPAGRKILMRIGSLDDDGDIYINGEKAHSRKMTNPDDWQSSFAFDVTPFVKPGQKNVIAVRGYDSMGAGGIWRPCALYTE